MAIEDRFINPAVEGISEHVFKGVLFDYALGEKTRAQALAALNNTLSDPLSVEEQSDLNTLADTIDAKIGLQNKLLYSLEVEIVIAQAISGADYLTGAAIRTRLGL